MEDEKLIVSERHSYFQKKIYITLPICYILINIFLSLALIISVRSVYWKENKVCLITNNNNDEQTIPSGPVYYSRPRRNLGLKTSRSVCLSALCCDYTFGAEAPWTENRLPTNVNPIDYKLSLEMHNLTQSTDEYNGTIDIILEVLSNTSNIVLHADLTILDIQLSQRKNENASVIPIDCALPNTNTQTLRIYFEQQLIAGQTYDLRISFKRALSVHGTGLFENQFNTDLDSIQLSRIILTHFKSVHAREAFPCFDEPSFKAYFELTVIHENNTHVLSNWIVSEKFWHENRYETEFQTGPQIPTSRIAFAIFYNNDFDYRTTEVYHPITGRSITVNLWARKIYFTHENGASIDAPLEMVREIFTALLNIFQDIQTPVVRDKLDILTVPEYPSDAVSHWGLMIFTERALLHSPSTTSEMEHQRIALLIAKELAEQWYGNFISFKWWTDLWLQEAIVNYLKYRAIDIAYPDWNIHSLFAVTELLPAMYDDSMSSSHPIYKQVNSAAEIDELFDSIETTKAKAILRMADSYIEQVGGSKNQTLLNIITFANNHHYEYLIPDEFLSKYQIHNWQGVDFFDRWLYQSNFPIVSARYISETILQFEQKRFLRSHFYDLDLYPSETNPFAYTWYIPITCRFSNQFDRFEHTQTFFIEKSIQNFTMTNHSYEYFYCNTDFTGYFIMSYTNENWNALTDALDNDNQELVEIDRANLLTTAFLNAQTSDQSYLFVRQLTQFLQRTDYTGLIPWQALSYHVHRMLDVVEYESLYEVVQKYFQLVVRNYYRKHANNLWNNNGTFSEQILKNIIIELACRVQLPECIDKVTSLWYEAYPVLDYAMSNHSIVPHARETVYRIHFQNSYNDSEWITIESDYHNLVDIQERYRLLKALTQSRQIWHLYQLLYQDAELNKDRDINILELLTLISQNPTGREMIWLYYRENWLKLQLEYGWTNQRLGQLLIDITSTFEDEFHESELLDFLVSTTGIVSNLDARFWSLERSNINLWWIRNKSSDIINSFTLTTY